MLYIFLYFKNRERSVGIVYTQYPHSSSYFFCPKMSNLTVHMTDNMTDALMVEITGNLYYHNLLMDQMTVSSTVALIPVITSEIHTNLPIKCFNHYPPVIVPQKLNKIPPLFYFYF